MGLTITTPEKTINGLATKVIAMESQALYPVIRKDYTLTAAPNNTGGLQTVRILGVDVSSEFEVGDRLWYVQGTVYTGQIVTVNSVTYSAPNTSIVFDIAYLDSNGGSGYINNLTQRAGYNIQVDIRDKDDTFSLFDKSFLFVPSQSGEININLKGIIDSYQKASLTDPASTDVFSFEYFARFTEVWEGSSETPTDTTTLQAVGAYKQIGLSGGSAMWENLLRDASAFPLAGEAKLLTKFENPVMWKGWNRKICILKDSEYDTRNGTSNLRIDYASVNVNKGNRVSLGNDSFSGVGPGVLFGTVQESSSYFTEVKATTDGVAEVSEILYYENRQECQHPIMLDWINSKGGIDQWLFSYNQVVDTEVGEGVLTERPINEDFADVKRTKRRFKGPTAQSISMTAENLTRDQLFALEEIKQTESLRCYLSKDGTKFVDVVVVEDFAVEFNTRDRVYSFTVIVEFPDDYSFFVAKEY